MDDRLSSPARDSKKRSELNSREKVEDPPKRTKMEDHSDQKIRNSEEELQSSTCDKESSVSSDQSRSVKEKPSSIITTELANLMPDSPQAVTAGQIKPGLIKDVSSGTSSDFNAEGIFETINKEQNLPNLYEIHDSMKFKRTSECGSSVFPLEIDDSLRRKELKQNGFVSSSLVYIQTPEQHASRSKNDVMKERFELAKREQINRFRKVTDPSGLLSGLNPGIINHVRNRRQVHSIIEAIVKSEKCEYDGKSTVMTQVKREISDMRNGKDLEGQEAGCGVSDITDGQLCGETFGASYFLSDEKNGMLTHSLYNVGSANQATVQSLAVRAATVSSQWLELLYQDTKRRLHALKRSKKRVQNVIRKELPLLLSKRSKPNEEYEPHYIQSSVTVCAYITTSDLRREHWAAPFFQMERALCEEEQTLKCFFRQVEEMRFHCERSFQSVKQHEVQPDGSGYDTRSTEYEIQRKRLGIWATAASIYSTGSFAMTGGSVSDFKP